jgi:hypothetical protein
LKDGNSQLLLQLPELPGKGKVVQNQKVQNSSTLLFFTATASSGTTTERIISTTVLSAALQRNDNCIYGFSL